MENKVGYSQHNHHPKLNVVTIDDIQVNGLWLNSENCIQINMYADHDVTAYNGKVLKENSKSREQLTIVKNWIYEHFEKETITERSGTSTAHQYWYEWTIKIDKK